LLAKIEAQGLIASELTAQQGWAVFLDFATLPFDVPDEPDSDGLLYQFGTFRLTGEPAFYFDPVRQFAVPDEDEYVQVHLQMQFAPDLAALGQHTEWWFADSAIALNDWAQAISRRPEWRTLGQLRPSRVEIYQEET
jgi:hypothetical protein